MKWNEYNAAVSASNESARADSHHRAGPEPPRDRKQEAEQNKEQQDYRLFK